MVTDLEAFVEELELNGRNDDFEFTRPWVLVGFGLGGALATSYVALNPGSETHATPTRLRQGTKGPAMENYGTVQVLSGLTV